MRRRYVSISFKVQLWPGQSNESSTRNEKNPCKFTRSETWVDMGGREGWPFSIRQTYIVNEARRLDRLDPKDPREHLRTCIWERARVPTGPGETDLTLSISYVLAPTSGSPRRENHSPEENSRRTRRTRRTAAHTRANPRGVFAARRSLISRRLDQ
jgi:hypothetical protein